MEVVEPHNDKVILQHQQQVFVVNELNQQWRQERLLTIGRVREVMDERLQIVLLI